MCLYVCMCVVMYVGICIYIYMYICVLYLMAPYTPTYHKYNKGSNGRSMIQQTHSRPSAKSPCGFGPHDILKV